MNLHYMLRIVLFYFLFSSLVLAELIVGEIIPTLITSDVAGNHQTIAGNTGTSFGQNVEGVGLLEITIPNLGRFNCTASLLTTGNHILVAAHCVTDINNGGVFVPGTTARIFFDTVPGGGFEEIININVDGFAIHPNWNGDAANGFDVAVLSLENTASDLITRYDINRDSGADIGATFIKVGYGVSGIGDTGADQANFPAGTKRAGLNQYEASGSALNIIGINSGENILIYDFDNGNIANDAQTFLGLPSDLGFGADEVNGAPGDSGGPTFLANGLIAGLASFGLGFNGGPDVSPGSDFSFGEISADTRVSFVADFIDAQLAVPEPSLLFILVLLCFYYKKKLA